MLLARDDWGPHCGPGRAPPRADRPLRPSQARTRDRPAGQPRPPGAGAVWFTRRPTKLDDAKALVAAIKPGDLTGEEPRALKILQADLALAAGDVPGARTHYLANTNDPSGPDVRSSIRRTAKIGQARAFLDRKGLRRGGGSA